LKMNSEAFYFRFGKLEGNYKALKAMVDPFAGTSLQARGTAGGMSGSSHLVGCKGAVDAAKAKTPPATDPAAGKGLCKNYSEDITTTLADEATPASEMPSTVGGLGNGRGALAGFTHSSYVNNALELGSKFGGFSVSLQGVWDQTDVLNGGGLVSVQYSHDNFDVFAAAAYTDLDSSVSGNKLDSGGNWKIGGDLKLAGMTLGLQYEHAEIGTLTDSFFNKKDDQGNVSVAPIAGTYLLGSIDFRADNLAIGGWVAKYSEDKDEVKLSSNPVALNQKGEYNNDALSFAVGLKYFLSKRTLAFGGYQQTNSENNVYDQKVVGVGVRHSF